MKRAVPLAGLVLALATGLVWLVLARGPLHTAGPRPEDPTPTPASSSIVADERPAGETYEAARVGAQGVIGGDYSSSDGHDAVGQKLSTLYSEWSDQRHHELFEDDVRPELVQEQFEWYRNMLGECSAAPEVLLERHPRQARYALSCERGVLEIEPLFNERGGKAHGIRIGARGVDPPATVREVAERVVGLLHDWDQGAYEAVFSQAFVDEHPPEDFHEWSTSVTAKCGACALGPVDLANPRGAIYFLECEHAERIMKLDLDDEDRVRSFLLRPRRPLRPEPSGP